MTPTPLAELRLSPKHHLSALWWLGLLYRRPSRFREALEKSGRWQQVATAARLVAHFFPYALLLIALGRFVLFGVLDLPTWTSKEPPDHLTCIGFGLAFGLVLGLLFGLFRGLARGLVGGLATFLGAGIALGLAGPGIVAGILVGLGVGVTEGLGQGLSLGIVFGAFYGYDEGLSGVLSAVIAGALAPIRLFYFPVHLVLLALPPRANLYRYHPAAWDDLYDIRWPGLYRLLVAYAEEKPEAGTAEIERLIDTYPAQRFEAVKAKTILVARKAGRTKNLARLGEITAPLPEGEKGFLSQSARLKDKIAEIAEIQSRLDATAHPFLWGPTAQLLVEEIEIFRDQIAGFREPLASELRAAAKSWLQVATEQRDRARKKLGRDPTAQVFRAGDPVDRDRQAFVARLPVFEKLQRQAMLATGCPGILLYGRRGMGKSTLLENLLWFLPPTVQVVRVSMQNPEASSSHALFARHLVEAIQKAALGVNGEETPHDLPSLYRFLDGLESHLRETGERLLLGVDEFENIDRKIQEGVFTDDLLATLRESIQGHRQITWVFSGSHSLDELDGAEWASYLVSARTVEVPPFTPEETRLLLTEPLKHSRLWDRDDPARPTFSPEMWGDGGIERIQEETGGWPHLVQLVAETLVDRLNDEGKERVDEALYERGVEAAVVSGDVVLSQLLRRECRVPGEWEYLAGFRKRATQPPPEDEEVRRSLRRRLLVVEEETGGEWRLRAPLFARWLRQRG